MQLTLTTSDNQSFTVERALLKHAGTIETLITSMNLDDTDADAAPMPIPLPNVTGPVLKQVIDWLTLHKDDPVKEQTEDHPERNLKISDVDKQYLATVGDVNAVIAVIEAANYLDVKGLLETTIKHIALNIQGKDPEQIRATFGITKDFTAEEEAQIKKENEWCES